MRCLVILVGLLLAGCASIGTKAIKDKPADWPPLTTTKSQLMQELGPLKSTGLKYTNGKTTDLVTWAYSEEGIFQSKGRALTVEFAGDTLVSRTWSETINYDGLEKDGRMPKSN